MWVRAVRVRFFWLLAALIGFILVAPSLPNSIHGKWESLVLVLIIFFAASYVSKGLQRFWILGFFAILITASVVWDSLTNESTDASLFMLGALLVTLAYTSICVLTFVLDTGQVGEEHIYGAICAYVLVAMAFATLDLMLELLSPGSFSGVHTGILHDRPWWQFFYFSMTTLSTVGYGDIVPATMRARSFVVIEQLIAIFYVAILISRLTGMYNHEPDIKKQK